MIITYREGPDAKLTYFLSKNIYNVFVFLSNFYRTNTFTKQFNI